jgi:thiaminase/transcriptional activator TenA
LTDKLGALADRRMKQKMTDHFVLSSRYEFMFWEQAYHCQEWPV